MASHILSIVVQGPGTNSDHRSHWSFIIHQPTADCGILLDVQIIDLNKLIYQHDERSGVDIRSKGSEGSFAVATLAQEQKRQALKVIREEPAPKDGVEKCQDWTLRAIISLEAEELVPSGTSAWIETLVGQPATDVARAVGDKWVGTAA
ncbi:hypothetical protein Q7P37_002919 [Cladosporium fusiforme]